MRSSSSNYDYNPKRRNNVENSKYNRNHIIFLIFFLAFVYVVLEPSENEELLDTPDTPASLRGSDTGLDLQTNGVVDVDSVHDDSEHLSPDAASAPANLRGADNELDSTTNGKLDDEHSSFVEDDNFNNVIEDPILSAKEVAQDKVDEEIEAVIEYNEDILLENSHEMELKMKPKLEDLLGEKGVDYSSIKHVEDSVITEFEDSELHELFEKENMLKENTEEEMSKIIEKDEETGESVTNILQDLAAAEDNMIKDLEEDVNELAAEIEEDLPEILHSVEKKIVKEELGLDLNDDELKDESNYDDFYSIETVIEDAKLSLEEAEEEEVEKEQTLMEELFSKAETKMEEEVDTVLSSAGVSEEEIIEAELVIENEFETKVLDDLKNEAQKVEALIENEVDQILLEDYETGMTPNEVISDMTNVKPALEWELKKSIESEAKNIENHMSKTMKTVEKEVIETDMNIPFDETAADDIINLEEGSEALETIVVDASTYIEEAEEVELEVEKKKLEKSLEDANGIDLKRLEEILERKGLKPSTIHHILSKISSRLDIAVEDELYDLAKALLTSEEEKVRDIVQQDTQIGMTTAEMKQDVEKRKEVLKMEVREKLNKAADKVDRTIPQKLKIIEKEVVLEEVGESLEDDELVSENEDSNEWLDTFATNNIRTDIKYDVAKKSKGISEVSNSILSNLQNSIEEERVLGKQKIFNLVVKLDSKKKDAFVTHLINQSLSVGQIREIQETISIRLTEKIEKKVQKESDLILQTEKTKLESLIEKNQALGVSNEYMVNSLNSLESKMVTESKENMKNIISKLENDIPIVLKNMENQVLSERSIMMRVPNPDED